MTVEHIDNFVGCEQPDRYIQGITRNWRFVDRGQFLLKRIMSVLQSGICCTFLQDRQ